MNWTIPITRSAALGSVNSVLGECKADVQRREETDDDSTSSAEVDVKTRMVITMGTGMKAMGRTGLVSPTACLRCR